MAGINPIMYQAATYPMYGVNEAGKARSSSEYIKGVLQDLDINQCETKIDILRDKYSSYDTTAEQKCVLGAMLRDATAELAALKEKYGVA